MAIILIIMQFEQDMLLNLLDSQTFESYILSIEIIQNIVKTKKLFTQQFSNKIIDSFKHIQNIPLLIYLSEIGFDLKSFFFMSDPYKENFRKIVHSVGLPIYERIIYQLQTNREENKHIFSCFILTYLPTFFSRRLAEIEMIDLHFLFEVFDMLNIQGPKQIEIVHKFLQTLKNIKIKKPNKNYSKESIIIWTALSVIKNKHHGAGNISLIFDDYLLGNAQENHMRTFCSIFCDSLSQFTASQLLSVLNNLFKSTITIQSLAFLRNITTILIDNEEFYKLKEIFSKFIIPYLIRLGKTCRKLGVQEIILSITQVYVNGFRMQFSIDEFGIQCFLFNLQNVFDPFYRKKWLQFLFRIINIQQDSKSTIKNKLLRKGFQEKFIRQCFIVCHENPWEITTRNIRQHKAYKKMPSNYKGIKNKSAQCYIISSIQALFMMKHLPRLLSRCSVKSKLLNSLAKTFKLLQQKDSSSISVNDIQYYGPIQFAESYRQQDAQLYLLGLFSKIEEDLKKTQFLRQFKDIFQIRSITEVTCKSCGFVTTCKQNQYIHSVYYKEKILFAKEETIQDFSCQKCGNRKSNKKTKIDSRSQILIVHINRFSHSYGTMRKMLQTEKILRKIDNYQLTGIIFHIGKQIQCGHYVYFSKLQKKRWIQFNDQQIAQFMLEEECQQFERQFKAEKTPYILFYTKVK